MRKYTQIQHDKAYTMIESDEMPVWPPYPDGTPVLFVDITDHPEVQPMWDYDPETGIFTPPQPEPQPEPEPYLDPSEETQMQTLLNTEYLLILAEINSGF